ncbi:MAG: cupin domain-containing protein [Acidobacteria bacterium]|nr:cupin domain-containing protein [Acidobacteriota bacterium]
MTEGPTKTISPTITPEQMEERVVRFKNMTPRPKLGGGMLPDEVVEWMTADTNYTYMAPASEHQSRIQQYATMKGGDAGNGISVSMVLCSPGRGPALHAHLKTIEAFFCLSSRFAIEWGDHGENSLVLEPWDFIHVPTEVVRTFHNVGDEPGALLVIIQGDKNEFDDVVRPPFVTEQITELFGEEAAASFTAMGERMYSATPK